MADTTDEQTIPTGKTILRRIITETAAMRQESFAGSLVVAGTKVFP
jgi:hypothetical protein